MDKQLAILNFGRIFVQGARWWATEHFADEVEVPIVAWTDVMLDVRMPRYEAAKVSANVREHQELVIIRTHDEHPQTVDRLLPAVDGCANEAKWSRCPSNWIVFERS